MLRSETNHENVRGNAEDEKLIHEVMGYLIFYLTFICLRSGQMFLDFFHAQFEEDMMV
jgi:hypothetical protein